MGNDNSCFVEWQNKFVEARRRQEWVLGQHVTKLPGCDDLKRDFGLVRGSLYQSEFVVVDSEERSGMWVWFTWRNWLCKSAHRCHKAYCVIECSLSINAIYYEAKAWMKSDIEATLCSCQRSVNGNAQCVTTPSLSCRYISKASLPFIARLWLWYILMNSNHHPYSAVESSFARIQRASHSHPVILDELRRLPVLVATFLRPQAHRRLKEVTRPVPWFFFEGLVRLMFLIEHA